MKRFKFLLDATEVDDPVGWDKMIENMSRDRALKGIFLTHDSPLEFIGNGYTLLYNKRGAGYCSSTQIIILESCNKDNYYELVYSGLIDTSDCEFTLNKCIAKAKINDNSFYAKIHNNKSLECYLTAGKSKNGLLITPIALADTQYFIVANPSTGYNTMPNTAIRVFDALKYLIAFMTDDEVDFASPVFDTGGLYEGLILTTGYAISNSGVNNIVITAQDFKDHLPVIKYTDLFNELDRRCNLGFYFDLSGTKPKIIIDEYEKTKVATVVIDIPKIKEIKASYFVDKLYSAVRLGGQTIDNTGTFPEQIRLKGFKQEEYPILGKCNLDNVLDLTTNFVSSSNIIENLLKNAPPDNTYDNQWFIIDCAWDYISNIVQPYAGNWITGAASPGYYNERLTNEKILTNYLGGIPNTIAVQLGVTDNTFSAEVPNGFYPFVVANPTVHVEPAHFSVETHDPGGNFNPTGVGSAYSFVCPVGGLYNFFGFLQVDAKDAHGGNAGVTFTVSMKIRVYQGGGFGVGSLAQDIYLINYSVGASSTIPNMTVVNLTGQQAVNLAQNDVVCIEINLDAPFINTGFGIYGTLPRIRTATFQCIASVDGGGVYHSYDPEDYPIEKYVFKKPLSRKKYNLLKRNILDAISFDDGKKYFKGWVENLKYNLKTSEANFTIMSKGHRPIRRCGMYNPSGSQPYYQHYGRMNRHWTTANDHRFTLMSMVIDGVQYSTGQVLNLNINDLVFDTGLDGNLYVQNVSDWINTILPQGWKTYDDLMAIDSPNFGIFEFVIKYEDVTHSINYGNYKYNNLGFFLPSGTLQAYYACKLI